MDKSRKSLKKGNWIRVENRFLNNKYQTFFDVLEIDIDSWKQMQKKNGNIRFSDAIIKHVFRNVKHKAKVYLPDEYKDALCTQENCILKISIYTENLNIEILHLIGLDYGREVIPMPDFLGISKLANKCIDHTNFNEFLPLIHSNITNISVMGSRPTFDMWIIAYLLLFNKNNPHQISSQGIICNSKHIKISNIIRKQLNIPSLEDDLDNLEKLYNITILNLHTPKPPATKVSDEIYLKCVNNCPNNLNCGNKVEDCLPEMEKCLIKCHKIAYK